LRFCIAGKGVQLMQKRKPRVVEWNSCIDVPCSRGILVHVLLLDRYTRPAEKRGTAHADLLVGAQVLADQCKQSAGESVWVSPIFALVSSCVKRERRRRRRKKKMLRGPCLGSNSSSINTVSVDTAIVSPNRPSLLMMDH